MTPPDPVTLEITGPIARLRLQRPETLNALDRQVSAGILGALAEVQSTETARVLVLQAEGRGFCAGANLKEEHFERLSPLERTHHGDRLLAERFNPIQHQLVNLRVPTIASIQGVVAGGGVGIALAADLAIASESVRFHVGFTPELGIVPDLGVTWHLARGLSRAQALATTFLGDSMPAKRAVELGLIWKSVPDAELESQTQALATRLADGPTQAFVRTRKALDEGVRRTLEGQLELERELQRDLFPTHDFAEGITAFIEKRARHFRGD